MPTTLFVSAITAMEFESGARQVERSDRVAGAAIRNWIDTRFRLAFEGRILAIDDSIVRRWSVIGCSDFRDGMLAATALQHGLVVATRHPASFKFGKVKTVNPWNYSPDADELDWRRASRSAPLWLKNLFVRA